MPETVTCVIHYEQTDSSLRHTRSSNSMENLIKQHQQLSLSRGIMQEACMLAAGQDLGQVVFNFSSLFHLMGFQSTCSLLWKTCILIKSIK